MCFLKFLTIFVCFNLYSQELINLDFEKYSDKRKEAISKNPDIIFMEELIKKGCSFFIQTNKTNKTNKTPVKVGEMFDGTVRNLRYLYDKKLKGIDNFICKKYIIRRYVKVNDKNDNFYNELAKDIITFLDSNLAKEKLSGIDINDITLSLANIPLEIIEKIDYFNFEKVKDPDFNSNKENSYNILRRLFARRLNFLKSSKEDSKKPLKDIFLGGSDIGKDFISNRDYLLEFDEVTKTYKQKYFKFGEIPKELRLTYIVEVTSLYLEIYNFCSQNNIQTLIYF